MAEAARPAVYTIPIHRCFADALVAGVMRQYSKTPLALAHGMLLLPNNRAVGAVRDAFIRLAGGAMLLPRLVALGDGDLDDRAGGALDRLDAAEDPLPPTVDPLRRRFLLARMIADERAHVSASEALRLADGLGQVIDQLAIEGCAVGKLVALDEGSMPKHWEDAFSLLQTILRRWPEELAKAGAIDRADLRNHLLDRTAARWKNQGLPVPFVIAAGITTAAPAVARLLRTIAFVPGGTVVLPHCDTAMPQAAWDALGGEERRGDDHGGDSPTPLEGHPQYHLKLLLDRMGIHRDEVLQWPDAGRVDGPPSRLAFMRHMLAPAAFTAEWPAIPLAQRRLPGVSAFTLANPAEEALTIALAMRETLEHPGRTAALITPDRAIAARVAGHLARWGIVADDSAGQPLVQSPPGGLLMAVIEAAASGFAPVELMALLNHPLVSSGADRLVWLDHVRALDRLLRGPRPAPGLAAIGSLIAGRHDLAKWWSQVSDWLAPIASHADPRTPVELPMVLAGLRAALDGLSGDAVWSGAAGRALSVLFEQVERHVEAFTLPLQATELSGFFRLLMQDAVVRQPKGEHPRLFIWGLIEARLQRADRMILAGLNEGQWPQPPSPDPWLAPMVRRRLGLPGLDRQVGLSAHDFASALSAPDVILTRSQREGNAPTVPSRLWLRIEALTGDKARLETGPVDFGALSTALDACARPVPMRRPAPSPPADRRPRRLSVTEVDTLLVDPFAFYARAGLGLTALDPLDAEPGPPWRGTQVHAVLDSWLKGRVRTVEEIERLAVDLLAQPGISPLLRTLWWPRLIEPLRWAAQALLSAIAEGREPILAASEARGVLSIGGVQLTGKPDRIDRHPDGSLAVVDYKTGSGPGKAAVAKGYALQLGLLGAMAERGAFAGASGRVSTFEYWRMNRGEDKTFGWIDVPFYKPGKNGPPEVNDRTFADFAYARAELAIQTWLAGSEPFVARRVPAYALYDDHDQLMRLEEWYGQEGGDDERDA